MSARRAFILESFESFRAELDGHNDKRERLIKYSRDITNSSKKVIFLLHRLVLDQLSNNGEDYSNINIAQQGRAKLLEMRSLFAKVREEIDESQFWRYQKNISHGLQEYIEALSFIHYLEYGTLVSFTEVQRSLSDENGVRFFPLPLNEYLLGVSDLTGELMRFAITAISTKGGRNKAEEVCKFVRSCQADFEGFTPYVDLLSKKQAVTAQSILKIEEAAYAIALRAAEYGDAEELLNRFVDQYKFSNRHPRGIQEQDDIRSEADTGEDTFQIP